MAMEDSVPEMSRSAMRKYFQQLTTSMFGVSPFRLLMCNGVSGRGVSFSNSFAEVDYIYRYDENGDQYRKIFLFSEIFETGCQMLGKYIELGEKPVNENERRVFDKLLSFTSHIKGM
jgi:hypothetical protein